MSERRFFLSPLPDAGVVALSEDIVHHVAVLRLGAGAPIVLFDGKGKRARATLVDGAHARIDSVVHVDVARAITIAAPLLKGERQDWLVEKLCELGVAALQPIESARTVINELSDNKRARLERIVVAACKQSGRADLMRIEAMVPLSALAERKPILLSPRATAPLIDVASAATLLVIGPEGGFTDDEEAWLLGRGAIRARIDAPVLRAETAAIAAAAIAVAATNAMR